MTAPIAIASDDVLDDVEHHFRVTAGPGAGKTHWLVNHICHVARIGTRLTPCARIGVISYTNVAVREIVSRLGNVSDKADVSTIHSFLFRNVVRPYAHLLKTAEGSDLIAHGMIDSHEPHFPAYDKVSEWVKASNKGRILSDVPKGSKARLWEQLGALTVRVNEAGDSYFAPRRLEPRDRALTELFTPARLLEYKLPYWREGQVAHEDVLYFAHRILREHPSLRRFLSDRFPYLFIDEFQDTLPLQGELVRWLAESGTVIGVIGDPEQAIFSFVDASPEHFANFQLAEHRKYIIHGNRRSTKAIVDVLNRVRTDGLVQQNIREEIGVQPVAYAGTLGDAIAHARVSLPDGTPFLVLAWKHTTLLRARLQKSGQLDDPWDSLESADEKRGRFLKCILTSLDLAQRQLFDLAINRLVQGISSRRGFRDPISFNGEITLTLRRSLALSLLEHLLPQHETLLEKTAIELYSLLRTFVPTCVDGMKLSAVQSGKAFHTAASAIAYSDLFRALHNPDEARETRTIHQAKGAEYAAVFVVLENDQIPHILSPSPNEELQRLVYVAISRAEEYLFVYCPEANRLPEFAPMGMATYNVRPPDPEEAML